MRKYNLNTEYFKEINSKEKAYALGFIYADGCVYQSSKSFYLSIAQHARGRGVLEYIKKCLEYTGPILYNRPQKRNGQTYYYDILVVCNKDLVENLNEQGVIPRKSLVLGAPKLRQEFIGSFIRGYFDGDGHASIRSCNGQPIINFCGTFKLLSWIENNAENKSNIYSHGNVYYLNYTGRKSILPLIALMGESPFGMERKTKKLDEIAIYLEESKVYERRLLGYKKAGIANLGKTRTDAAKKRMSIARLGEKNSRAKLSTFQILEIRKKLANGSTGSALAKKFGVNRSTISKIKTKHTWSHLK